MLCTHLLEHPAPCTLHPLLLCTMLVDTHCHLAAEAFAGDLPQVLERAWAAGVAGIVVIGESRPSAERAMAMAESDERIWATAGIHPHDASSWTGEVERWLELTLRNSRVVAAGEMGLDFHYDHSPRDTQRRVFERQLEMAEIAGKPAVIHAREADGDVAAVLLGRPRAITILHSFSSGPALLRAGLERGSYLSFSGMITFKNWRLDEAIESTPLDRILIETDAPYLAPTPHRGKRNEPAFVRRVAEQIAAVRRLPVEEVVAATGANAARVFGFHPSPSRNA
jgi:TatD DNase family protein